VKFMLALIRLVRRTQAVLGSASCRVARASRVLAKPSRFRGLLKIVSARRRNQHARRVRYPAACAPRNSVHAFPPFCNVLTLLTNHEHFAGNSCSRDNGWDDKKQIASHNPSWSKSPLIIPAIFTAMPPTARHNRRSRRTRRRTIKVGGKRSHPPTWSRLLSARALARPWE
jgi:hypothetical protein